MFSYKIFVMKVFSHKVFLMNYLLRARFNELPFKSTFDNDFIKYF